MITLTQSFISVEKDKYISLVTFRKSGTGVPTPVWFALHNGTIYVETFPSAGKLKRIHHTPRVTLAPCTLGGKVTGAANEGRATLIADPGEVATARAALSRKYGLTRKLYYGTLDLLRALRRRSRVEQKYIAIVPVA
jgi:uncharacterized protein